MTSKIIFGFGSLMDIDSLTFTIIDPVDIRPAYIKGFIREFNLWSSAGLRYAAPDLKNIPFCALDIRETADQKSRVNGVIFETSNAQLERLKDREAGYKLVRTTAYDFKTGKKLGACYVFSACKNDGKYAFDSASQKSYLETCIRGARKFGDEFYQEFLNTTYIGDKTLSEVLELNSAS